MMIIINISKIKSTVTEIKIESEVVTQNIEKFAVKNKAEIEKEIKLLLEKYLPKNGPGGSIAVFQDGEPLVKVSHGFENMQTKTPITENTRFDMASVSKHFTGAAILLLHQDKTINLTDEIMKLLPEFKHLKTKRPILIKDLVYMIEGFADYTELVPEGKEGTYTNEQDVKLVIEEPLNFPVGNKYDYSNTAYMLLALIVKRASNGLWSEFLSKRIFSPLNMEAHALDHKRDFEYVQGYKKAKGKYRPTREETTYSYGDGNVFLSINDFEKWEKSLIQNTILSKELLELAYTPGKLDSGKLTDYGFGMEVGKDKRGKFVEHTGGWEGTTTIIHRWLDQGISYAFFVNIDDFSTENITDRLDNIIFYSADLNKTEVEIEAEKAEKKMENEVSHLKFLSIS